MARSALVQDAVFALVLAALAFAPGLVDNGVDLAELPHRPLDATGIALGLGQCLPLVVRRRVPLICLTVVAAVFAVGQLLAYRPSFGSVGLLGALYAAGAYRDRRPGPLVVSVVAYLGLCLGLHAVGSPKHAPGRDMLVQVEYAKDDITVRVANEQLPGGPPRTSGGGRGIAGLRAPVAAVGGELSAEPGADGGFVVRARLPLR